MAGPLHIAFLGCGFITGVHSRHLKALGDDVVRSYASRAGAKAEACCRRHLGAGTFDSYTAAIEDPGVDAVVVAVPPRFHLDLTLEALAAGVPVVCSRFAARGTDAVPGEHLLTADTPDEYCEAILRLLNDPTERERFSHAGRARMLSHHSWTHAMERLDELVARCVGDTAQAEPQKR